MPITLNGATGISNVDGSASTPSYQGTDTNTGLFYPAADTVAIGTGGSERLRVDSSGNVGIGTSSPATKLHINGNNAAVTLSDTDTTGNTNISFNNNTTETGKILVGSSASPNMRFDVNGSERFNIDSSGYATGTVNGLGEGRIPAMQYYRLNSNLAGANATGAQNVFGVGVTLVGSTQYAFDYYVIFTKSAGATSHNFGIGFGGTATINNIQYGGTTVATNAAYTTGGQGSASVFDSNTAANTNAYVGVASAARNTIFYFKGTVSVNAGGTFIPQYTLSTAPGGAYSTQAGSYFSIYPLAASGSNVSIGSWA